jgi:hypothetical protein
MRYAHLLNTIFRGKWVGRRIPKSVVSAAFVVLFAIACSASQTAAATEQREATQRPRIAGPADVAKNASPVIIIGFVGGWVRHDNLAHSEVQLAVSLQKAYPWGVHVEAFENANGPKAVKKISSLLDVNHDGRLTTAEKQDARIILYGHSWGASEAITVARELGAQGVPVLLTIEVDSVAKRHENDRLIPANVAQAANFYQPNGLVHGQNEIIAEDPAKSKIIGNFKFNYGSRPYSCTDYPWYDRLLANAHTQIECDPNVWKQVESLIRQYLPPAQPAEEKR